MTRLYPLKIMKPRRRLHNSYSRQFLYEIVEWGKHLPCKPGFYEKWQWISRGKTRCLYWALYPWGEKCDKTILVVRISSTLTEYPRYLAYELDMHISQAIKIVLERRRRVAAGDV